MLNVFPIMFLSLLAHFILRVTFGGILLYVAYRHAGTYRTQLEEVFRARLFIKVPGAVWLLVCAEVVIGTLLVLGLYTQIAALLLFVLSLKMLYFKRWFHEPIIPSSLFYVAALGVSLSLFITGAGAFAFDLPI